MNHALTEEKGYQKAAWGLELIQELGQLGKGFLGKQYFA